jgi:hypothetical protein
MFTISTKPTVAKLGYVPTAKGSPGQDPRNDQVKNGDFMKHPTSRQTDDRHLTDPADEKHGSRQNSCAVDDIFRPGFFYALSGDIVRIDRHPAGGDDQVRACCKASMNLFGDPLWIVGSKSYTLHS